MMRREGDDSPESQTCSLIPAIATLSSREDRDLATSASEIDNLPLPDKETKISDCALVDDLKSNHSFSKPPEVHSPSQLEALSQLPKIGSVDAHRNGSKYGLTPGQTDYKIKRMEDCAKKGMRPSECKKCKNIKAYRYHSFSKRGGTKELYCCAFCFYHWSNFSCEEEDYDFLSG